MLKTRRFIKGFLDCSFNFPSEKTLKCFKIPEKKKICFQFLIDLNCKLKHGCKSSSVGSQKALAKVVCLCVDHREEVEVSSGRAKR